MALRPSPLTLIRLTSSSLRRGGAIALLRLGLGGGNGGNPTALLPLGPRRLRARRRACPRSRLFARILQPSGLRHNGHVGVALCALVPRGFDPHPGDAVTPLNGIVTVTPLDEAVPGSSAPTRIDFGEEISAEVVAMYTRAGMTKPFGKVKAKIQMQAHLKVQDDEFDLLHLDRVRSAHTSTSTTDPPIAPNGIEIGDPPERFDFRPVMFIILEARRERELNLPARSPGREKALVLTERNTTI